MRGRSQAIKSFILALTFFSSSVVMASDLRLRPENFTHLTIEDGLPQNDVYCIEEDQYGFIWLCTADGLVRYDGYEFELVTQGSDGSRISNTVVRVIQADGDSLWIGTDKGLNRYDLKDGVFENYFFLNGDIQANKVKSLESNEHAIFVGTRDGLFKLDKVDKTIQKIKLPDSYGHIRALKIIGEDVFIGGFQAGLLKYSIKNEVVLNSYRSQVNNKILTISNIGDMLWIGLYRGSYYVVDQELNFRKSAITCNDNNQFCKGKASIFSIKRINSTVWLAGTEGLYKIENDQAAERIDLLSYINNPYITNSVTAVHILNDNELLITLGSGGLVKLELLENPFTKYYNQQKSELKKTDGIYAIEEYKGDVYIGTYSGLLELKNNQSISKVSFSKNSFTDSYTFRIVALETFNDELFIGSYDGLYSVQKKGNTHTITKVVLAGQITSLASDNDNLWIGTAKGKIYRLSSSLKLTEFSKIIGLEHSHISELVVTNDFLYIGSIDLGLAVFNKHTQELDIYNSNNSSLQSNSILSLQVSNRDVWIGTRGASLSVLNQDTKKIKPYRFISEKIGNSIYAIQKDELENIWVSSNNGVVVINQQSKMEKHYTINSGLLDKEYNFNASQFKDGFMYFGGTKGVTRINTRILNQLQDDNETINISKIVTFMPESNTIKKVFGPEIEEVELKFGSFIKIYLSTSGLNAKSILNYEYMLEGGSYDKYWSKLKNNSRVLSLNYLKSGNYNLYIRAKAINNSMLPSVLIRLTVNPPMFLSNFAIFSYVMLAMFLVMIMIKVYIKMRLTSEKNVLFKIELDNKKRNIASLSHDLRTPLNSIVMLSDSSFESDKKSNEIIYNSAILLRSMISNSLDQSILDVGNDIEIKISRVAIDKMIKSIVSILGGYFKNKELKLVENFNIPVSISFFTDKTRLEQLCINILTNAIKHSPKGASINLTVDVTEHELIIKVKDYGKGIAMEEQKNIFQAFYKAADNKESGIGLGLYISREIVTRLNGDISLDSEIGRGAEFVIRIPNVTDIIVNDEIESSSLIPDNIKILMVDDDPFNRIAFQAMCEQVGIETTCIGTVEEFFEIEKEFDCYLFDLNLGSKDLDGIALANDLKRRGNNKPKILLTADVRAEEKIAGTAINDIIIKPITLSELIITLNRNVTPN